MKWRAGNSASKHLELYEDFTRETVALRCPAKGKGRRSLSLFQAISSEQNTEVLMNGRKVLMFGSNSYMGLTNHPKVIEAENRGHKEI